MINYDLDPEEMTIDQIADELVEICEANPEQRNPSDGPNTCLNTSRLDPDHHCLVAQFLVNHGVKLPAADSEENSTTVEDLNQDLALGLSESVVDFLLHVQAAADGGGAGPREPWGEMPSYIKEAARDANDTAAMAP